MDTDTLTCQQVWKNAQGTRYRCKGGHERTLELLREENERVRHLLHLAYEAAFHDGGMTPQERDEMRRALTPIPDNEEER